MKWNVLSNYCGHKCPDWQYKASWKWSLIHTSTDTCNYLSTLCFNQCFPQLCPLLYWWLLEENYIFEWSPQLLVQHIHSVLGMFAHHKICYVHSLLIKPWLFKVLLVNWGHENYHRSLAPCSRSPTKAIFLLSWSLLYVSVKRSLIHLLRSPSLTQLKPFTECFLWEGWTG